MTKTHQRKAPRSAFAFAGTGWKFAEGETGGDEGGGKKPVEILARSNGAVDHWYWGRCYHDMSGFSPSKPTIALDYCHDSGKIIGFANAFTVDPAQGLVVKGELVSLREDDLAAEVFGKAKLGVPYEASIFFDEDASVVEYVFSGAEADVNGQKVAGPATIFRKWSLRGLAVCPYGVDKGTLTKFALGDTSVTCLGDEPAPANPPEPAPPRQFTAAQLEDYIRKFGKEHGPGWLAEGRPLESCFELSLQFKDKEIAAGKTALAEKDKQLGDLHAKLKLAKDQLGADPATFSDAERPAQPAAANKFSGLTPGLSAYAASLKAPE